MKFANIVSLVVVALICGWWNSAAQAVVLDAGLVGYWSFDGNANDMSGFGNDGTVMGAQLVEGHDGIPNSAFRFDGIDDQILVPDSASLSVTGDLSISAWIRFTADPATINNGSAPIVSKYNSPNNRADYVLDYIHATGHPRDGEVAFNVLSTGAQAEFGQSFTTDGYSLTPDEWVHIVATFDASASQMQLYVNSVANGLPYTSNTVASIHDSTEPFRIGASETLTGLQSFLGDIDSVRVYNRVLEQDDVNELFSPTATTVPEPMTAGLTLLGLGVLAMRRRRAA